MRAIFISYRREDAEGEAGRLFDDLVAVFGEHSVFMDVAGIKFGVDFRKAIDESLAQCGVLLAIMGKDWVDAKNTTGQRRLEQPNDFVRIETAKALGRDIPVIPVLVQGAKMPQAEQLPDDLKDLAYRNGVELTGPRWRSDVQLLIEALRPYVGVQADAPDKADATGKPDGGKGESVGGGGAAVKRETEPPPKPPVIVPPTPPPPTRTGLIVGGIVAVVIAAVVAYVAFRPPQVTVPDLVGMTLPVATARLQGLKLAVGQITSKEDPTKDPDTILSQSLPPNSNVKSGTVVDLVISQAESVEVPDLKGRLLKPAQQMLRDRNLRGEADRVPNSDVPPNTVIDTDPVAGTHVKTGSIVTLKVAEAIPAGGSGASGGTSGGTSGGAQTTKVSVPPLIGRSLDSARSALQAANLALGSTSQESKSGFAAGTVLRQIPAAGSAVEPHTQVSLVVSAEPALAEMTVTSFCSPQTINAGGRTGISVTARGPDGPLAGATVTVNAGGGMFSPGNSTTVSGTTDNNGLYRLIWTAPNPASAGYGIGVVVTKQGFQPAKDRVDVSVTNNAAGNPGAGGGKVVPKVGLRKIFSNPELTLEFADRGSSVEFLITTTQPNMYPMLQVDVNQNGVVDRNIDTAYGFKSDGFSCFQYMLSENSYTGCGGFTSHGKGVLQKQGDIWRVIWVIPKSEISNAGPSVHFLLKYVLPGKGWQSFPSTSFARPFNLQFTP